MWLLAVLQVFAADPSENSELVSLEVMLHRGAPVVLLKARGAPVTVPECRGVSWERFDPDSGTYKPVAEPPCGAMAPAIQIDDAGQSFQMEAKPKQSMVVRPVVVVGVGCRQGEPFAVAGCQEMHAVLGKNLTVQ